jgi:hypothetical protein
VTVRIYLEGGGHSKELHTRCQKAFHELLKSCGFAKRMPKLVACGSRFEAYDRFRTAQQKGRLGDLVFLWIDSEDPMADIAATWTHLKERDNWVKPQGATDDQVLMMTTCMETWIVADRQTLREHYGQHLRDSGLPTIANLELRTRDFVQEALKTATAECANRYEKGKRSFQIFARLNPDALKAYLPSFERAMEILSRRL